jgi:PilZ domain
LIFVKWQRVCTLDIRKLLNPLFAGGPMAAHQAFTPDPFHYSVQRREPRVPTDREVALAFEGVSTQSAAARVLDWSINGFRISHGLTLRPGDQLLVVSSTGSIRTRVVWVTKTRGAREAGLVLLTAEEAEQAANNRSATARKVPRSTRISYTPGDRIRLCARALMNSVFGKR